MTGDGATLKTLLESNTLLFNPIGDILSCFAFARLFRRRTVISGLYIRLQQGKGPSQ